MPRIPVPVADSNIITRSASPAFPISLFTAKKTGNSSSPVMRHRILIYSNQLLHPSGCTEAASHANRT